MCREMICNVRRSALGFIVGGALLSGLYPVCAKAADPTTKPAGAFDISDYTEPPENGAASGAVGGLTRGVRDLPLPLLYAPLNHLGLTSKPQPVLYFYVPAATANKVVITLIDTDTNDTLSAPPIDGIKKPGIQRFDVASTGQSLKPGVSYKWSVSIRSSTNQPAKDAYAGVNIRYMLPTPELTSQLAGKPVEEQAEIYAKNHFWFDTVDAAVEIMHAHPGEAQPKEQFRKLLKVGNCPVNAGDADSNP